MKELRLTYTILILLCFFYSNSFSANQFSDKTVEQKKPNILLIVVDDLGISDLGCYGADLHETPNIDKLAQQGISFSNAYASAPVCSPTRASIMTGKYPARLHMTIWRESAKNNEFDKKLIPPDTKADLPTEDITIAEQLKNIGYLTAHVGKWHLGDAANYPEMHGYDINVGASHWGCPPTFFYPYRGRIYDSERYVPGLELSPEGKYFVLREGEYLTDRLTDEALKILEEAKGKPLFLCLNYYAVHTPIEAKLDIVDYYKKKITKDMHHQNPVYAAMVQILDENVGRIMLKIEELGISGNTVIMLTSDNGGYINEWDNKTVTNNFPFRSGKGSLYEGGINIPLIIRHPKIKKHGVICKQPTISADLYPTILAITGSMIPDIEYEIDGKNILPLLKKPDASTDKEFLFWHYPHYYETTTPVSAIRNGEWKLLKYYEDKHIELYNLTTDPGESNDVSTAFPAKAKELQLILSNWLVDVNAQLPARNMK